MQSQLDFVLTLTTKILPRKSRKVGFTYEIEHTKWVSLIIMVSKKNGKHFVCINLKKVNTTTIRDNYCLPIIEHLLERVARKEAYNFLDAFSGYNQVTIHPNE